MKRFHNLILLALLSFSTSAIADDDAKASPAKVDKKRMHEVPLRINCGGPTVGEWISDETLNVKGGNAFEFPEGDHDTSFVEDPAPQDVYDTVRHRDHAYLLRVPAGRYMVRLHCTEWEQGEGRHSEYWINGVRILAHYDMRWWAGGDRKPMIWECISEVEEGKKLVIQGFKAIGQDVYQAAIEVIPVPADTPLTTGLLNGDADAHFKARDAIKKKKG